MNNLETLGTQDKDLEKERENKETNKQQNKEKISNTSPTNNPDACE